MWTDLENGMVKLFAQFDPETGARIRNAIDEEVDRVYRAQRDDPTDNRSHQHVVSDAIANLILGARATGTSRTELVVLIDLHTLITGDPQPAEAEGDATVDGVATTRAARPAASGRCCETSHGTPLPIEAVRRIACESGIVPAVLNGDGVVVDLGRSQRLASAAQRQALQVMYPTCAFNGCTTSFARCEIHHIDPFGPPTNGETNIDKLVPACQRHHHHIHDHHLKLTLAADTRTLTVTSPDGSAELHPLPTRRRRRPGAEPGDLPRSA